MNDNNLLARRFLFFSAATQKPRACFANETPEWRFERICYTPGQCTPYSAASLQLEFDVLGFQRLSHPPYNPDLAPMDFRVFPEVKSNLRDRKFDSAEDVMAETLKIVSSFDKQFYTDTYNQWIVRHRKCIRIGGDYVEKV